MSWMLPNFYQKGLITRYLGYSRFSYGFPSQQEKPVIQVCWIFLNAIEGCPTHSAGPQSIIINSSGILSFENSLNCYLVSQNMCGLTVWSVPVFMALNL